MADDAHHRVPMPVAAPAPAPMPRVAPQDHDTALTEVPVGSRNSVTTVADDAAFTDLFSLPLLRKTTRTIRKEARMLRVRDVIDWVDWFTSVDTGLELLRQEVISGEYVPAPPTRYELAKSRGSFRIITSLGIRDAIVFRHICDFALTKALPLKVQGAYFSRSHSRTPIGKTFDLEDDSSHPMFEIWLRYHQYRTRTLLNDAYQVLVVTDITNYFDSIQHDLLLEYLSPLGFPRKLSGLLGRLLEAFKPLAGHSPNPRVGLAVDDFECSRQLAHIFLFEHDRRIADRAGEENYVRWMDDQNIGAKDYTDARRLVNELTRSLSSQKLTLNAGKTKFLDPEQVVRHFQLAENGTLDEFEARAKNATEQNLPDFRDEFERIWQTLLLGANTDGNWDKILKRAYALATAVDSTSLETRAYDDLVEHPYFAERIFSYFAKRNRGAELLELFKRYCAAGENLFEHTEAAFFETLLLLDPPPVLAAQIREFAWEFAKGSADGASGRPVGRASAILVLYWFGVSASRFRDLYNHRDARNLPKEVARTWLAVVAALKADELGNVKSILLGHPSDDVARLASFLTELLKGTLATLGAYKSQRRRWPLKGKFYDSRAWLLLDIASRTKNRQLQQQLGRDLALYQSLARTTPEKRVLTRVRRRLGN